MSSGKMVKINKNICGMCKYRSGLPEHGCNYIMVKKHSRVYEDGKLAYDPRYCDKFERGAIVQADFALTVIQRRKEDKS